MKTTKLIIAVLLTAILVSGCSSAAGSGKDAATPDPSGQETSGNILDEEVFAEEVATLENQTIDLNEVNDNIVNITNAGSFVLTGKFKGQIKIQVNKGAEVKLILDNVTIENEGSACIWFAAGKKLTVSSKDGTSNVLKNTGVFQKTDNSKIDGCIFSKGDLHLSGHGELEISSQYGHGVVSKDDFHAKNATVTIDAKKKGIEAKDNATFESGTFNIKSGSEGIEAFSVDIEGGVLNINAGDDGINARDPSIDGSHRFEPQEGVYINISGGEITIKAGGDGIDSNGDITISDGVLTIKEFGYPGDSAIDYNGKCEITGGEQNVPEEIGRENMKHGDDFGGFPPPPDGQKAPPEK